MAVLNITHNGRSTDFPIDVQVALDDSDVRRVAIEVVRAGGHPLAAPGLPDGAFDDFVVDRMGGGERIYLRPKVPFGAGGRLVIDGIPWAEEIFPSGRRDGRGTPPGRSRPGGKDAASPAAPALLRILRA